MMGALGDRSIIILGAGIVGVCAALELQQRGANVTLLDRADPGRETSYGNAGVMARSSIVPLNNPSLWPNLFRLLSNKTASLRYTLPFVLSHLGWTARFLANARQKPFMETAAALDHLIRLSADAHRSWLMEAGVAHRLNENGWLFLYRSEQEYRAATVLRQSLQAFAVDAETLSGDGLCALEPALNPIFPKALWVKDTTSVDNPGDVVKAYAKLFVSRGGKVDRREAADIRPSDGHWMVTDTGGRTITADSAVVCLGPWSRAFLKRAGMRVPMACERGYHMHYRGPGEGGNAALRRPIYDPKGGYVLSPMDQGLRLTTGVELTRRDAPKNTHQLERAERSAREAIGLGERLEDTPWLGSRPTLPDSRPAIGQAPGRRGLYLAFGHQHVGFSTGPGTARLLADIMEDKAPSIPKAPFDPSRFITQKNQSLQES